MRTIWVRVKNHIDLLCKQLQFCVCESASLETCIMLTLEICISAARMVHFSSRQCMTINQWDADCFYQMTTICITHDMKVFFIFYFLRAAYVLTTTVLPQNYYLILLYHCLTTNQLDWGLLYVE